MIPGDKFSCGFDLIAGRSGKSLVLLREVL